MDKTALLLSIIYVVLPIIIFCFGWLKLYVALLSTCFFVYLIYKFFIQSETDNNLFFGNNKFWFFSIVCLLLWLIFSGIGNISFQNADFWVRNPIYHDLFNLKWPIIIDLSTQPDSVQSLIGSDSVLFSYYFSWWLTPALICKVINASDFISNVILFLYSFVGLFLVLYLICKIQDNCKLRNVFVFIFFSGLDIVLYLYFREIIPIANHIEFASNYFQFSSNTTQLFWVFNQSIPIWIITALTIYAPTNIAIAISSLSFAYSPWCTVGIVPIILYRIIRQSGFSIKKIANYFSISNITIPMLMLLIFGLFYTSNGHNTFSISTMYKYYGSPDLFFFYSRLILFLFTEVFIFVMTIGWREYKKYDYSIIILLIFAAFTFFYIADYNMHLRAPIPAQFILMLIILKAFENKNISELRKKLLILLLLIGSITAITEINRGILNEKEIYDVYTFSYMDETSESHIQVADNQFFSHNYDKKPFYYLLKK